ncbi:hypothetical protein [Psychrobacter sanguinis]|uniref:hypothetical protein n=1 Tax=Psychrobacter sanguinis TaxID=861445 RepID=UPI002A74D571|nr:hypothetical protein [Psychrobacter sanguinis]MDY3305448.1 hypothetical protein [Psychrobacter sanguinis]
MAIKVTIKEILKQKVVTYCLFAPFIGGFIFVLSIFIEVQFSSLNNKILPMEDIFSDLVLPLLGAPLLGLIYIVPAFITYVFSEVCLLFKPTHNLISLIVIMIFGGIASTVYTVLILPDSQNQFKILTSLIGLISSGMAEYLSAHNSSTK